MVLPRMAALAEVQWTQLEKKDYTNFTTRLAGLICLLSEGFPVVEPVSPVEADESGQSGSEVCIIFLFQLCPLYFGKEMCIRDSSYPAALRAGRGEPAGSLQNIG